MKDIPITSIKELASAASIKQVVSSYLAMEGNRAVCPFHNDRNPSFFVSETKNLYYCFGCKSSGNVLQFVMRYLNVELVEAAEHISEICGFKLTLATSANYQNQYRLVRTLNKVAQLFHENLNVAGKQYLYSRGVTTEVTKRYLLGYADNLIERSEFDIVDLQTLGLIKKTEHGYLFPFFQRRIILPIRTVKGEVHGFGSRAISEQALPKYLHLQDNLICKKHRALYGVYEAKVQNKTFTDGIIVVEGYFDVLQLAQVGINNSVASLGTNLSSYQIKQLLALTDKVYLCWDGDQAGQDSMLNQISQLAPWASSKKQWYFITLPQQHDPDSFIRASGAAAFRELVHNAQDITAYFMRAIQGEDIMSVLDKAHAILQVMPDCKLKMALLHTIATKYKLSQSQLRRVLSPTQIEQSHSYKATTVKLDSTLSLEQKCVVYMLQNVSEAKSLLLKYDLSAVVRYKLLSCLAKAILNTASSTPVEVIMCAAEEHPEHEEVLYALANWQTALQPKQALEELELGLDKIFNESFINKEVVLALQTWLKKLATSEDNS